MASLNDRYMIFSEERLAFMIACTILNRFDFYIIVDGLRGTGKSSTAYRLSKEISKIFRKLYKGDLDTITKVYRILKKRRKDVTLENFIQHLTRLKREKAYLFEPEEDLIYDQQSAKEFLQQWHRIGVFDEFINIGFSRDFFDKGQKDLIKMINLNRDHCHVILACVPHFATIDNQLRNLSKMRIYIKERGMGIIMQPNKSLTLRDKWDMDANQKIERKWLENNVKHPRWEKLSTFRGLIKTRPLTAVDEERYQKIKTDKRNEIIQRDMGVSPKDKIKQKYEEIYERLKNNTIRDYHELDGIATGLGIKTSTLRDKLRDFLKEDGKPSVIKNYFFDPSKAEKAMKVQKSINVGRLKNEESYEELLDRVI